MAAPLSPRGLHKKIYFHLFSCLAIAWQFYGKGSPLFGVLARYFRDALLIFRGASERWQSEAIAAAKEQGWAG